jgi:hypothetical protein
VSDIGRSLERGLAWVNASPARAIVVVPVLGYVFGLGIWSYFWSGSAIREWVGNGLPANDGMIWAGIFVGLTLPAVIFSVFLLVFVATQRWWSLVLMVLAFAPVIFSAAVNPTGVITKTRKISKSLEEMTIITGDAHVAEVINTAVYSGKAIVLIIAALSILWVSLLGRRRRFPDASSHHRAAQDDPTTLRSERLIRIFRWAYPFAVVLGIPLIALAGAANAS